jgi:hypothetical protein
MAEDPVDDLTSELDDADIDYDEEQTNHPFEEFQDPSTVWTASTQEVLGWFGRERRGAAVVRWIREDLDRFNLEMKPSIEDADYYGNVTITPKSSSNDLDEHSTENTQDDLTPESESRSENAAGWILSSLKADADTLDFLCYGETTNDAIEKMKSRGRSKLPLFFDENDMSSLIGTITLGDLTIDNATEQSKLIDLAQTKVPVLPTDDSLMDWIPAILQYGFVYGKRPDGTIVQIYTVTDVAHHLTTLAQMFLRANELEDLIRGYLSRFDDNDVESARDSIRNLTSIPLHSSSDETEKYFAPEDLSTSDAGEGHIAETFMFSDYMKCFGAPEFWDARAERSEKFRKLDKEKCIRSLNDARLARNRVMHVGRQDVVDTLIPSFEAAAVWLRKLNEG